MKIAIVGYGKMGKAVEKIAIKRGHEISLKINQKNQEKLNKMNLSDADVVIDFSTPNSAKKNILIAIDSSTPAISGTTGWIDGLHDVCKYCLKKKSAFLHASNFSLGVNLFFELNKNLAKLMKTHVQYQIDLTEIHHIQKLDSPSGTAITLAEHIIAENKIKNKWTLNSKNKNNELKINAQRKENVMGTHQVTYNSDIDSISIKHEAHSRKGFALGAVVAAEWIQNKKGVFNMHDVLFSNKE